MHPQDLVITTGSVLLAAGLYPSIASRSQKPHLLMALVAALVLTAFSLAYATTGWTASALITFLQALGWYYLVLQQLALAPRGWRP